MYFIGYPYQEHYPYICRQNHIMIARDISTILLIFSLNPARFTSRKQLEAENAALL